MLGYGDKKKKYSDRDDKVKSIAAFFDIETITILKIFIELKSITLP